MLINKNLLLNLRKISKASYIDCLNVLKITNNIEEAKKLLEINYSKKISKETENFKLMKNYSFLKFSVFIIINYKTEFIENNNLLKNLLNKILYLLIKNNPKNIKNLENLKLKKTNIENQIKFLSEITKESISIYKFIIINNTNKSKLYIYNNKINIYLKYKGSNLIVKDICIHIISKNTKFISLKSINYNFIKFKYKHINKNKNKIIKEKFILKEIKEKTLFNQNFIKKPNIKLKNLLKKNNIKIYSFFFIKI